MRGSDDRGSFDRDRGSYDRDRGNDNRSFRSRDDRGPFDRDRGNDNRGNDNRSFRSRDDRGPHDRDRGRDDRGSYDNDRDRQSRGYNDQPDRNSSRGFDDMRRSNTAEPKRPSAAPRKEELFPPLGRQPIEPTRAPQQNSKSSSDQKQVTEIAKNPLKQKQEEEKELESQRLQKEEEDKKADEEELQKQGQQEVELLQKFITLKDGALLEFCKENEKSLSNQIETLTYSLCEEHKDLSWISTHKSAFHHLIPTDDMSKQLNVLFGLQKYCHSINFPKENNANLIHTYFEKMLSEDIVSYDSFFDWKDDEKKEHEAGKMKAIIQTMDWFTFLEDMMEDEEEEGNEEEEEEY